MGWFSDDTKSSKAADKQAAYIEGNDPGCKRRDAHDKAKVPTPTWAAEQAERDARRRK